MPICKFSQNLNDSRPVLLEIYSFPGRVAGDIVVSSQQVWLEVRRREKRLVKMTSASSSSYLAFKWNLHLPKFLTNLEA